MIANSTTDLYNVVLNASPLYSVIPIAWAISAVSVTEGLIVISYLRSKPPLSQSTMDLMNTAFFIGQIPWTMLMALYATILTIFQDSGAILGSLVAYSTPASGDN